MEWFPSGARIEYKPSKDGDGWSSLAYGETGRRLGAWLFYGPEIPKRATAIVKGR